MRRRNGLLAAALFIALPGLATAQDSGLERRYIQLPEMAALNLPFSAAVMVGDTLYLSGNGGLDTTTMSPPDDPQEEAKLMMEGFIAVLAQADMTLDDLVTVTIYSPDLSLYSDFNEVYSSYFSGEFPARAFIGSGPLLFGMRFEMQAIAVRSP